jgi:hypothetical protein
MISIAPDGAESLARVLGQYASLAHLDLSWNDLTSISAAMISHQMGQRVLQECWGSTHRWLTSISAGMTSDQTGQRALQECWGIAHRWLTSTSAAIGSIQIGAVGAGRMVEAVWTTPPERWKG